MGDARPGDARRRRRGADRGLVRAGRAGGDAGGARGRRARARLRRRMGRATHRVGVGVGCAPGRRGRCAPDPRPQRVRRPLDRSMGARDRRRALRVPRGRVALRVDARAAAATRLAQGRRGDAGDHADDRSGGCRAAGPDPRGPRRRARPARGVVRPRRLVALAPPARRRPGRRGGSGPRPAGRRPHGPRPPRRVGRPRRPQPAEPAHARRVREAPDRGHRRRSRWPSSCPEPAGASWPGWSGRRSASWSS